jgi:23S rRNA pseudouridine1911/1915/1917 synthase
VLSTDGLDPGIPLQLDVPADAAGSRLDQFLAGPAGSRAQAQQLIEDGRVEVDGRVRPKRHVLRGGERVAVRPPVEEPADPDAAAAVEFGVVYEDEHLLVVDKPAGLVVHPARGHRTGTLAQALAGRSGGGEEPWRAGIVHRLDRDTSGLLVVAKNDSVHRALKALITSRAMRREYLALVAGVPPARSGTIEAPIGRDRRDRVLMSIDSVDPRAARTHFTLERALGRCALVRVVLDTGRTHQIRVHMASIGHPVLGDRAYGGPMWFGLERQFLHAARLAFVHPVTGESLDVGSELPPDLKAALDAAQQAGSLPAADTSHEAT